jgi:hypothetical protein
MLYIGTLLTTLILMYLIALAWRDNPDSSGLSRLGSDGPPLARKFSVLSELGALALIGLIVQLVSFRFRYPPALTALLYATLAYGYLLHGSKPAEKQPDRKAADGSRLLARRH